MTDEDLKELGSLFKDVPGRKMSPEFQRRLTSVLANGEQSVRPQRRRTGWWMGRVATAAAVALAVGTSHPWSLGAAATPGNQARVASGLPTSPSTPSTPVKQSTTTRMGNASGGAAVPDYVAWHNAVYQVMYSTPNAPARYFVSPAQLGRSLGQYQGWKTNRQPFALYSITGTSSAHVIAVELRDHAFAEAVYAFPLTLQWQGHTYHTSANNPVFLTNKLGPLLGHTDSLALYAVPGASVDRAIAVEVQHGVYVRATR